MGSIGVELFDDVIVGEFFSSANSEFSRLQIHARRPIAVHPGCCRHMIIESRSMCTRQRFDMNSIMQVLHARPRPLNIILTESIQCIRPHWSKHSPFIYFFEERNKKK